MQTYATVRLDTIPPTDKALWDLGKFAFVASHFFSVDSRHSSTVAELLDLTERLKMLHTEVSGDGFSSSPIHDTSLRCVADVKPRPEYMCGSDNV